MELTIGSPRNATIVLALMDRLAPAQAKME